MKKAILIIVFGLLLSSNAYELVPEGGKINLGGSLEHAIKKKVEGEKEANYNQN